MVLNDTQLAILGDRATQERITERGELLPCPFCGEKPATRVKAKAQCYEMSIICFKCGTSRIHQVDFCDTEFSKLYDGMILAIKFWNTRAPILTPEQIKRLEVKSENQTGALGDLPHPRT